MIGAVNHSGGSYTSSPNGGVKTESWEIDTTTGVKTYTSGERAGQTEQVMPAKNTTQYATSTGTGNNNTLLYILLAVAGVGVVYIITKSKGKKK
jgi:hypothetical protein